jgi:CheY-like chemotaxis protein
MDVPVIIIVSFALYDNRSRALESGYNAHLTKPINPIQLHELINNLVDTLVTTDVKEEEERRHR